MIKLHHFQDEVLGSVGNDGETRWGVLLLDPVTTHVFSAAAGVSDLLDYGISCTVALTGRGEEGCACGGECTFGSGFHV